MINARRKGQKELQTFILDENELWMNINYSEEILPKKFSTYHEAKDWIKEKDLITENLIQNPKSQQNYLIEKITIDMSRKTTPLNSFKEEDLQLVLERGVEHLENALAISHNGFIQLVPMLQSNKEKIEGFAVVGCIFSKNSIFIGKKRSPIEPEKLREIYSSLSYSWLMHLLLDKGICSEELFEISNEKFEEVQRDIQTLYANYSTRTKKDLYFKYKIKIQSNVWEKAKEVLEVEGKLNPYLLKTRLNEVEKAFLSNEDIKEVIERIKGKETNQKEEIKVQNKENKKPLDLSIIESFIKVKKAMPIEHLLKWFPRNTKEEVLLAVELSGKLTIYMNNVILKEAAKETPPKHEEPVEETIVKPEETTEQEEQKETEDTQPSNTENSVEGKQEVHLSTGNITKEMLLQLIQDYNNKVEKEFSEVNNKSQNKISILSDYLNNKFITEKVDMPDIPLVLKVFRDKQKTIHTYSIVVLNEINIDVINTIKNSFNEDDIRYLEIYTIDYDIQSNGNYIEELDQTIRDASTLVERNTKRYKLVEEEFKLYNIIEE